MSRRAGHVVAGLPERAQHAQLAAAAQPVHAGGLAPRVGLRRRWAGGEDRLELLPGPVALALLLEDRGQRVAEVDEHLDVERGVDQPLLRQRPGAPVGGRVPLLQREAEQRLHDGAEPDPRQPGQPGGELGVEDPRRAPGRSRRGRAGPGWPRAAPTRRRAMASWTTDRSGSGTGSMQPGARAVAPHLHQVGALPVAVAGGALGVHRHRAGAGAQGLGVLDQLRGGLDDRGQPVAGSEQRGRRESLRSGRPPPRGLLRGGSGLGAQLPSTFLPVLVASGRRCPGWRVPMLESLAAARGRRDPAGARPAAADPPRCRAPPARRAGAGRGRCPPPSRRRASPRRRCARAGEVAEPGGGGAGDRAADGVVGRAGSVSASVSQLHATSENMVSSTSSSSVAADR